MIFVKRAAVSVILGFAFSAFATPAPATLTYADTMDRVHDSNLNQTAIYKRLDCAQKMENLIREFFKNRTVQVVSYGDTLTVDQSSIRFCGVDDQDQGSYDIDRHLTLCVDVLSADRKSWTGAIYATSNGDMFCDQERLVSVDGIWVH
jgi:hypothetical protein